MNASQFAPGTLVHARGRDWIVLTGSDGDVLRVRPISGSEEEQTRLHLGLEVEPVTSASFPPPRAEQLGGHDAALLLRDALLLSLRRGAGPFRSFGQISVEPRAYQLVPLLMALKLDPVRLLIADDVGIGKTIEAGLIARELLDRGDISRLVVLCPPHLVDQWTTELETSFHIRAVGVTAANARRLEATIPMGGSIFVAHPYTVVSLDYIKSANRRDEFLRACPELVIVDEAHTCAAPGRGPHQRYELLRELAKSRTRHLVLTTATPHSGDEGAFYRLLGLLDEKFGALEKTEGAERDKLREELSNHLVQRLRADIDEWKENRSLFPKRHAKEVTYRLTGEWERFQENVLDYCAGVVASTQGDERRKALSFWSTLALMRCVGSSPSAAASALKTVGKIEDEDEEDLQDRVFDGTPDSLSDDDVEPPAAAADPVVKNLIAQAERLSGQSGDPKLKKLTENLSELIAEDFNPVVFCRYLATAHYLHRHLSNFFPGVTVEVITGEQTPDERREKIDTLGEAERRILIATDCLSEGVNLQQHFDAVVHYDLSWNPTRHEQREGRVDRFLQPKPVVRAILLWGENNPVDGLVLAVNLRKAAEIRDKLGVPVPLPDEGYKLTQALLKAALLRRRTQSKQQAFDFAATEEGKKIEEGWRDARERAKKNRTVFAQRRLKPDDVLPEWKKTLAAIGDKDNVRRFTDRALARVGSGLEAQKRGFKVALTSLPEELRERLEAEDLAGTLRVDFDNPPASRCRTIGRSHPLVSVLAETLLDRSLADAADEGADDPAVLGRVGCWIASGVQAPTAVALLRLRHQLTTQRAGSSSTILVDEATAIGFQLASASSLLEGDAALSLIAVPPAGDAAAHVRSKFVARALEQLTARAADVDGFAVRRAEALLADHRRVREAAQARGSYSVRALIPADVIGLFVLLPRVD